MSEPIAVGQVWVRRGKMYLVTGEPIVYTVAIADNDEKLTYTEVQLMELETGEVGKRGISALVLSLDWSLLR